MSLLNPCYQPQGQRPFLEKFHLNLIVSFVHCSPSVSVTLGRFSVEDTRKVIPLYVFLKKCVSFRKDENNNESQIRNKNPAGFFLSGGMETRWRALKSFLNDFYIFP